MKTTSRFIAVLAAATVAACAADTRIWSLGDHSDFAKGKQKGLSLTSDGRVVLAPAFKEIFDSASVYLWTLAEDSKGNVYAGGGGPGGPGARVYMLPAKGSGKTLAQFDELEVHALAIDAQDNVYAATSPDGKVYRIRDGKSEVFYEPKAKYIWAMAFSRKGDLFVATGDRGEVHRVTAAGKGSVFYKSPETHARSLAIDAEDNLILGTEPGGLVVRVDPKGQGFVLYQTPKREVTAVAVAKGGAVYAAAVGNKQAGTGAPTLGPPPTAPVTPPANPAAPAPQGQRSGAQPPVSAPAAAAPAIPGGSELYRIDVDGFPRKVWTHAQDIAYAIGFDRDGKPLVGTGNKGGIYRIDSDLVFTELLNAPPTQVTAIHAGKDGRIYAGTGNVGKVYQIGPALEKQGALESEVFDAGIFSRWGRLTFRHEAHGGAITFATRSGNLDRPNTDWSDWSPEFSGTDGGNVVSPPSRFVQWRATLTASPEGTSPVLNAVDVAYLPRNVAPVIREIEATPPNYRFPQQSTTTLASAQMNITLPALGGAAPRRAAPASVDSTSASMQAAKGFIGARWAASDENGDTLSYCVYIRGEGETTWKLLKEKLADRQISWDSTAFPDGDYRVRVVATDAPDNPADQALTAELVSDPFTIDNTPPEIKGLAAVNAGSKVTVRWSARDALSFIEKAEYSVNGSDWARVEPISRLSDSRDEDYALTIDRPAEGELTIAVRVEDEYENRSVAKTVLK